MAKELKTNGIYHIACVVTGEEAGTTPKVFEDRAARYGVDIATLKSNYVGRTASKVIKKLVGVDSMTPDEAVSKIREQFNISDEQSVTPDVLNHIVAGITAKREASKEAQAFEANKAKALDELMS